MDNILKTPIEHEGKTYDIALIHLSVAPCDKAPNDYTYAVNAQIIPARKTEEALEKLYSHAIKIELTSDIQNNASSITVLQTYAQVNALILELTYKMNLIVKPE